MGTWGTGPFDDDSAADWVADLDDAAAGERAGMIEDALVSIAGREDYVEQPEAAEAVAAAAVVGLLRSVGDIPPVAPDFVRRGEIVVLRDDVASLAASALDRVVAANSEWRDLWDEAGELADAVATIDELRRRLG